MIVWACINVGGDGLVQITFTIFTAVFLKKNPALLKYRLEKCRFILKDDLASSNL